MKRDTKIRQGDRSMMVESRSVRRLLAEGLVTPNGTDKEFEVVGQHTLEEVRDFLRKPIVCDGRITDVTVALIVTVECSGHGKKKHVIEVPPEVIDHIREHLEGAHREHIEKLDWMQYINQNLN